VINGAAPRKMMIVATLRGGPGASTSMKGGRSTAMRSRSTQTNAPSACGVPRNNNKTFPLAFTDAGVKATKEHELKLEPK
jgi:hypothetical protein